jgi:Tetracyclin repressor-like, C-terminal domain
VIRHHLGQQIVAGAAEVARHAGPRAQVLEELLTAWWQRVVDSPASGVFKLVVTEVRNFPEIAAFYIGEVVEPGQRLIGGLVEQGVARGEFRPVDVSNTVHSLVLPMIMLCLHRHSIGACAPPHAPVIDAQRFIADHVALVLRGLRSDPAPGGPSRARK